MSDTSEPAAKPIAPEILASEFSHTEDIGQLAAAMSLAQGAFQPAAQTGFNPHFNKNHSDLEDVMNVIKGPFAANGLAVFQPPSNKVGANNVTVTTIIAHKSGQWMRCSLTCGAQTNNPQSMGSVVTYLRRYELMGMVGVTSRGEDDDGETGAGRVPNNGNGGAPPAQRQTPPANRPPATQSAPAAQKPATPPPAETPMPEAVKPWAERFEKLTDKDEFKSLVGSTKEIFDSGTPEKKALSVVINKAAKRLGIEPTKKPADTATGTAP